MELSNDHTQSKSPKDVLAEPILPVLYHIESRPEQNGESAVIESMSGKEIVFGVEWDPRTRVHEHKGAAACPYCKRGCLNKHKE
ncbi:hypothetical protein BDZ94DRAFT_1264840 [Collybia nuda]|uniref:Uncharacterized protein n=1 Tax=Collybia nuda TaxID=64659 RepID=A0A9P5Y4C5_9AGAR|nr:hypothetical protein BDZ94DRAFT_1264840 [Collybia nuda]